MTEKAKVLLVDDDIPLLRAIDRNLNIRFDTVMANSAAEALELLETSGPFAVMVSDVKMPGMDGIQLIQRTNERWPKMVSIILTGNQEDETLVRARKARAFRFLSKPAPHMRLADAIDQAVLRHSTQNI